MKNILLIFAYIFLFLKLTGQDKIEFQNQLQKILSDYPNKFQNILNKDGFTLSFKISGTDKQSYFFKVNDRSKISSSLPVTNDLQSANRVFSAFVSILDSFSFNGNRLISKNCTEAEKRSIVPNVKVIYQCKTWRFDNASTMLNDTYKEFTIELSSIQLKSDRFYGMLVIH